MKRLQVTRLDEVDDFRNLKAAWNRLLAQSESRNIFLTWEWLYAWWEVFGGDNRLWLLTVKDDDELIGIAPLMISVYRKAFFKLRVLRSIGTPQSDIGGVVASREDAVIPAIAAYLDAHRQEWDILEMNILPKECFENEFLRKRFTDKSDLIIRHEEKHFYLPLEGSWDEYLKGLSKNMRRNLRRRLKRAKEQGNLRYQRYAGEELHWAHFRKIFEINAKGNFPAIYRVEENKEFLRKIYELMEGKWLQVEMLYLNDEAVAFQCGFLFDRKYQDWRGSYDKKYETLGTGKLLMMFSLENAYKKGVREVDFLRGTHAYKADWKPKTRTFVDLRIFQKRSKEALAAYFWLKKLKPRLKPKGNKK